MMPSCQVRATRSKCTRRIYACSDYSDNPFTLLARPLQLTCPNSGEQWEIGTNHQITWTPCPTLHSKVKFKLWRNGTFIKFLSGEVDNDGSWGWTLDDSLVAGTGYKVQVYTPDYACWDYSDTTFTLLAKPLRLTSPNGGESWARGSVRPILWETTRNLGSTVKFKLWRNGQMINWVGGSGVANTGSYNWTLPAALTAGSGYKLQIYTISPADYVSDYSDTSFTVSTSKAE